VVGGGSSPLAWGRGASFLGRCGQSLRKTTEPASSCWQHPSGGHAPDVGELCGLRDVEIALSDFTDPFFYYMGLCEEKRRHRVGSQTIPPSALKNRRNSEELGGALRVSRVLSEFWTGFPWVVESFAFMQEVACRNDDYCAYE
jgi:hypothetical protein